ncbi:MAG: hypothetical protein ACOH5I_20775 [Oligoflexus sp.]
MNCKKIQRNINFLLNLLKDTPPGKKTISLVQTKLNDKANDNFFWTLSNQAIEKISHPPAKIAVETMLYSTVCFASAGIAIGAVGGPKGIAIGGISGAVCGLVCGAVVVKMIQEGKEYSYITITAAS